MRCKYCGRKLEEGQICNCPVSLAQMSQNPYMRSYGQVENTNQKKNTGWIPVLIVSIVAFLVLAIGGVFLGYYLIQGSNQGKNHKNDQEFSYLDTENIESESESENETETESESESETETESESETETESESEESEIHRYKFYVMDCTWEEAQEKCIQKGGYLVQINSPEEFDYITQLIEDQEKENIQFFIGGRRNVWDVDYYWVDEYGNLTGDSLNDSLAWCSSYWLDGEPSLEDQDMDETCMTMFYSSGEGRWVWNDVPSDILAAVPGYAGKIGFICEYDTE